MYQIKHFIDKIISIRHEYQITSPLTIVFEKVDKNEDI
jgi:hypothetical protein